MAVDQALKQYATEKQWTYYMAARQHGSNAKAATAVGVDRRVVDRAIARLHARAEQEGYAPKLHIVASPKGRVKRYVITSAQNNTPANIPLLSSLQKYCEHYDAELKVIPVNYENITLTSKHGRDEKWWSASVVPYLCNRRILLNDNLVLMGDVSVNATNVNPLSGFQTVTGKRSAILGHGQIAMEMVPTPDSKLPKMLNTTGSITDPNYSDSKAGKIADENHTMGALLVETDGDLFWIRQLRADDFGAFYDLDLKFTPDGVEEAGPALGLVCGDIHWDFICPGVKAATFTDKDSIKAALKPQKLILHDVLDFYSGSHHHERNPLLKFYKHHSGKNSVERELTRLTQGVQEITGPDDHLIFVGSNHNDHLGQWLNECDPKRDPENALIYHKLRLAQLEGALESKFIDPLEYWFKQQIPDRTFEFIGRDDGRLVGKYDISHHGDKGANGSRGSAKQFTKFGGSYIVGHSHTPGIYKNVIQVGTSSHLRLEYTVGPSSWLNTHAIIYPNGLASLIHIINGRWRA